MIGLKVIKIKINDKANYTVHFLFSVLTGFVNIQDGNIYFYFLYYFLIQYVGAISAALFAILREVMV